MHIMKKINLKGGLDMTVQELGWRLVRIVIILIETTFGITGMIQAMI